MKPVAKNFNNKCTNRPEACSICGEVFLTYNFESHFNKSHKDLYCPFIVTEEEKKYFLNLKAL